MLRALHRLALPPFNRLQPASKKVAILIPLSTRSELTPDERVSLNHLQHHLGHYDRYFLAPKGLALEFPETEVKRYSRKFFGSVGAHTRFLYWPGLYQDFLDYEFIFFYHLDALAFSDQLETWCAAGFDYIGPPWLNCADTPWVTRPRVGNCGFCLMRVESALQALRNRYRTSPGMVWLDLFTRNCERLRPLISLLRWLQPRLPKSKLINRPLEELDRLQNPGPNNVNTDIFWSDRAVRYLPEFKVAPFEEGLKFGFEAAPRTCLELNGGKMPFGCHAWPRYDRKFWEPFLISGSPA
jgi:hypothetical protein